MTSAPAPAVETAKSITVPRAELPACQVGDVYEARVTAADDQGVTLSMAAEAKEPSLSDTEQYDAGFADKGADVNY
jgi:hypothetical protein